jgi:DNA-binding LacI/PurR family transcriptional regulator
MSLIPRRVSLVTQTLEALRAGIRSGEWSETLPGELPLSRRLQISRVTLRRALTTLAAEGWISGGQGSRRRVLRTPPCPAALPSRTVVLLSPQSAHLLPSPTQFWIAALREDLQRLGWKLELISSPVAFRSRPAHALAELVRESRAAGWVLLHATPPVQRWFAQSGQPVVIAGSLHPGVRLPTVDADHAALGRHAAGRLRALGHHRLAVLWPETDLAGDIETTQAFLRAAGDSARSTRHPPHARGIALALERLFQAPTPPTALFVLHAAHLLTVHSWLGRQGLRVPEQVALIGRDDAPWLDFLLPRPARYVVPSDRFAREMARAVLDVVSGVPHLRPRRLLPDFLPGASIASPSGPDLFIQ